jgi:lysophospholipase L1-like esterase
MTGTPLRRPAVREILVAGAAVALALASLEVALRLFAPQLHDTHYLTEKLRNASLRDCITTLDDPELVYGLLPGADLVVHGARVVVSADGRRIPENGETSPRPGALRVAVLGDSTAFGWGVAFDQTYAAVLCARLEVMTSRPVELRNWAVPGYNTAQEAALYRQAVRAWKPHLVIIHRDPNDCEPVAWSLHYQHLHPAYGDNPLRSALIKTFIRRLAEGRIARQRAAVGRLHEHEITQRFISGGPLFEENMRAFAEIADAVREDGTTAVVVLYNSSILPGEEFESRPEYIKLHYRVAQRLRAHGLHVLDLYGPFERLLRQNGWRDPSPTWLSASEPVDLHPNPATHEQIAGWLLEYIEATPPLRAVVGLPAD